MVVHLDTIVTSRNIQHIIQVQQKTTTQDHCYITQKMTYIQPFKLYNLFMVQKFFDTAFNSNFWAVSPPAGLPSNWRTPSWHVEGNGCASNKPWTRSASDREASCARTMDTKGVKVPEAATSQGLYLFQWDIEEQKRTNMKLIQLVKLHAYVYIIYIYIHKSLQMFHAFPPFTDTLPPLPCADWCSSAAADVPSSCKHHLTNRKLEANVKGVLSPWEMMAEEQDTSQI